MSQPDFTLTLADIALQVAAAYDTMAASILALKETQPNPNTTPVGNSPRAFIMSSSELFKSHKLETPNRKGTHTEVQQTSAGWSVFFNDWGLQYEAIAAVVSERRPTVLFEILSTGKERLREAGGSRTYAPEVIYSVRKLVGDYHALSPTLAADDKAADEADAKRAAAAIKAATSKPKMAL